MTKHANDPLIIVGGGFAAGKLITGLRGRGDDRDIVLFGAEQHPPYERPPLSKGLLRGEVEPATTALFDTAWMEANGVQFVAPFSVEQLLLDERRVAGPDGWVPYSQLVFATGSRARPPTLGSNAAVPVFQLRTLDDAVRLRATLDHGTHLLVIGGGWIGLEVAASARAVGARVTVVERADQLLAPLGSDIGSHLKNLHESKGVEFHLSSGVAGLAGNIATLADGTNVVVDVIVVGVGAIPNDTVAHQAGLVVDNGVLVDAGLATSVPDVYAIGDVANHRHPVLGERVRVEHWQNAVSQAGCLARILTGDHVVYDELPYFFSDQYSSGLEFFGHIGRRGYDTVKVEPATDGLTVLWWRAGQLVAAAHVDDWTRSDELRERVARGR